MTAPRPIDDAVARLTLWARRAGPGLARVVCPLREAGERVQQQLRDKGLELREVRLPLAGTGRERAEGLEQALRELGEALVSVWGWEDLQQLAPKERANTLEALVLRRERLAALPCRQIWWLPEDIARTLQIHAVDLDDWFSLRLELPVFWDEAPQLLDERTSPPVDSPAPGLTSADIQRVQEEAAELVKRFERSRERGLDLRDALEALAVPAVKLLRRAGLDASAEVLERRLRRMARGWGEPLGHLGDVAATGNESVLSPEPPPSELRPVTETGEGDDREEKILGLLADAQQGLEREGALVSAALLKAQIAHMNSEKGQTEAALAVLRDEVVPVLTSAGDELGLYTVNGLILQILMKQGLLDEARDILRSEAFLRSPRSDHARAGIGMMREVARQWGVRGEWERALRVLREDVLPVTEQLADSRERARTLGQVAEVLASQGQAAQALRIMREEVVPLVRVFGWPSDVMVGQTQMALILLGTGVGRDHEEAVALLTQALHTAIALRHPWADKIRAYFTALGITPPA